MQTSAIIPTATYRLQFHGGFTFDQARRLAIYFEELGISHLYASPIFKASPGSLHGYDICDHNALNPEIGTRADLDALSAELEGCGMGLILDFVPNHMGISEPLNHWWMDMLENGPGSPFARYFDIDWKPLKRELENKVLLPILGDQYGRVLEKGDFRLRYKEGTFTLDYHGRCLPLAQRTTRPLLQAALDKLATGPEPAPPELASILTALGHLPERTETDPEKIQERMREKEIIKNRLDRLCREVPPVQEAIERTVKEIESGSGARRFDDFDALLNEQPYRLAFWRVAAEEINYRRFFDVNTLAALRMELPEVFAATHRLLFELMESGTLQGLRIDHVDGLWNPQAYLESLQSEAGKITGRPAGERPVYLLVEKILEAGEPLRAAWPIHGTTGYEFAAGCTAVLVDGGAGPLFTVLYTKFLGFVLSYPEIVYGAKQLTMHVSMASEINTLGHMLNRISETNRWYRDFTLNALTTAIREVIACFPVYRTYLSADLTPAETDLRVIQRALSAARRRNPALERTVFEFLRDVLLPPARNAHPVDEEARRLFVMRFQQCTGPIMAKGVEDTAFYVYNRLVALNEVGGDPNSFGQDVEAFHAQNSARQAVFPHSLLATSTHDTKRSEDVRARIAALSEMPRDWSRALNRWSALNRPHRQSIDGELAPDANEEYLLYQTLLGTWPLEPLSEEEHAAYVRRIQDYMAKALREAKVHSSWIEPNEPWDSAVEAFIEKILSPQKSNRFLKAFAPLAARIATLGAINSLSQTALKITVPGVPDIYQGQELWDLSLVDPDNRRPVDFALRKKLLAALRLAPPSLEELLAGWPDGRIKLFVTQKLLRFRRANAELFAQGIYTPIPAAGTHAQSCIAFVREHRGRRLLVVVPRLSSRVGSPPIGALWKDTCLAVEGKWVELFSGKTFAASGRLLLRDILEAFPLAVLVSGGLDSDPA